MNFQKERKRGKKEAESYLIPRQMLIIGAFLSLNAVLEYEIKRKSGLTDGSCDFALLERMWSGGSNDSTGQLWERKDVPTIDHCKAVSTCCPAGNVSDDREGGSSSSSDSGRG